jgi:hypothetical protein
MCGTALSARALLEIRLESRPESSTGVVPAINRTEETLIEPRWSDAPLAGDGAVIGAKRPYGAPSLTCYGTIQVTTLGPTPGVGESGNPTILREGNGGGFGG